MVASATIFPYLPTSGIEKYLFSPQKNTPSHLFTEMGGSFYYIRKTIRQIRKAIFAPCLTSIMPEPLCGEHKGSVTL